ncbi:MAG TPA: S49 family peptidase [Bacteroidales bacterium]|nr:S49 family peptidase [Bacteroidales bacterium]
MLQPHLIHAILYEPWAIMPEWVSAHAQFIETLFNRNIEFDQSAPELPEVVSFSDGDNGIDLTGSESAQLQIIKVVGALTKYDQLCGPAGMLTLASWVRNAADNPMIDAIVIRADSPGGMVAGTETLVQAIEYARSKKPVVMFVDDLAASAAYWVASACDEIIANNTTAQLGSIGVMSNWVDMQPVLERAGARFHTILAPQSANKVKMFDQIRAGNYDDYRNKVLAPLAQKFIDSVKARRPGITNDHIAGDVFFANDVVGSLIDSIGSFDFALQRAADLVTARRKATNVIALSQNPIHMSKPDYMRLAKAADVPQLETADGTINLSAEMALAVERALEAHETNAARLQADLNDRANQQSRITELEQELAQRDARIAELEKSAGAQTATIETEIDQAAAAEDFWSIHARLKSEFKR